MPGEKIIVTRPLTTLFFDWDFTLAYTEINDNTMGDRLAYMFAKAGLPYTQQEIEGALQQYEQDVAAGKFVPIPHPQKRRDIAKMYQRLFDYLGEEDKSWAMMERLYGTYASLPTFLYADSRPTLRQLGQEGYRLGIISNHSRSARAVIEELVGDLVPGEHIVLSEELGVHKPAKSIFRRAAARTGSRPEDCLLVGDNLQVDAAAAVARGGYRCGIWLDRKEKGGQRSLPDQVKRITSLAQLPPLLS